MSNRPTKKRSSSARVQAAAQAGSGNSRTWIIGLVAVVVVGVVIVAAIASSNGGGSTNITGRKDAPTALVTKLQSVPTSVISSVGGGTASALPKPIDGKSIAVDGKPGVLYIGAEFCPFCATERWAMANALMRFGTFTGLKITNSSLTDEDAGTKTLSFYGSTYTSDYIHFTGVETENNTSGALEKPTSAQEAIIAEFNSNQTIPFIYFDGKYVISGATYDVGVLQGLSWDQIASAMSDPSSAVAKGAIGAANGITATICLTTDNQPADVCTLPAIKALQKQIEAQPKSGSSSSSGNSSTLSP